jgi:succinate dehydrogenase / fumarate reductase cytochrome b subunit
MSTTAIAPTSSRLFEFFRSMIGKKAVMAVSGVVLFGYIVGHMLGNLQIFLGREKLNDYAEFLHSTPSLLWGTRVLLLVSVILHIYSAVVVTARSKAARPHGYAKYSPVQSGLPSYASRTMMRGGVIIAAFVVYHLLHLTFGRVHPFTPGDVYGNLVAGFRMPLVAGAYLFAVGVLGLHLLHGLYSMFQSLGLSHPRYTPRIKAAAATVTALIVLGYYAVPLGVLAGIVKD